MSSSSSSSSACPLHQFAARAQSAGSLGARGGVFAFGLVAYAAFFGTFLYAIGWVGNWLVPKSIDTGTPGALWPSLLINALLLCVFVVQHTVMARPAFKRWWSRMLPAGMERSVFVLLASASLAIAFWQWRPLPQPVWEVTNPVGVSVLSGLSLLGWATVLGASFMVSHFDLFGLRQVWMRLRARAYRPVGFRLVGLYRLVRHPLMLGFMIAFWSTPVMSVGHLLFCALTTAYITFGTWMEERDLVAEHGERYLDYRRRVRGIVPLPRKAA